MARTLRNKPQHTPMGSGKLVEHDAAITQRPSS